MTPDIPASRELDRRVADAIGSWKFYGMIRGQDRGFDPRKPRGKPGTAENALTLCPPYSTEFGPWTQEMLDWLEEQSNYCGVRIDRDPVGGPAENIEATWWGHGCEETIVGIGKSMSESIARLVLAVKEARDG